MKRFLILLLILTVALVSCADEVEQAAEYTEIPAAAETGVSCYARRVFNCGELYFESGSSVLRFIDFSTMKSAVVCPMPNCKHDDPETCPAFGMANGPSIYEDKIYFFTEDAYYNRKGDLIRELVIRRADLDGTRKTEMAKLTGYMSPVYDKRWIIGNKMWFVAFRNAGEESEGFENKNEQCLCSYDFDSEKITVHCVLSDGYGSGAAINGYSRGELYITCSRRSDQEKIKPGSMPDYGSLEYDYFYKKFDIAALELSETDINCLTSSEGYMLTDNCKVIRPDGSVLDVPKQRDYYIVNAKLFDRFSKTVTDLSDGTVRELNTDGCVIYYIDGEYVVRKDEVADDGLIVGTVYERVPESKLIGDKITEESPRDSEKNHKWLLLDVKEGETPTEAFEREKGECREYYKLLEPLISGIVENGDDGRDTSERGNIEHYYRGDDHCFIYTRNDGTYTYFGGYIDTNLEDDWEFTLTYTVMNTDTKEEKQGEAVYKKSDGNPFCFFTDPGWTLVKYTAQFKMGDLGFTSDMERKIYDPQPAADN